MQDIARMKQPFLVDPDDTTANFKARQQGRGRQGRRLDGDADIAGEGCKRVALRI
jgi:hypothetical protein